MQVFFVISYYVFKPLKHFSLLIKWSNLIAGDSSYLLRRESFLERPNHHRGVEEVELLGNAQDSRPGSLNATRNEYKQIKLTQVRGHSKMNFRILFEPLGIVVAKSDSQGYDIFQG